LELGLGDPAGPHEHGAEQVLEVAVARVGADHRSFEELHGDGVSDPSSVRTPVFRWSPMKLEDVREPEVLDRSFEGHLTPP
jgi:hypothetical protein